MARPRRDFGRARSARLTQWIGPPNQAFITVPNAGAIILSSVSFEEPLTIMRTRGRVSFVFDSEVADVQITGAIGMAIVSTEAFTAGVASIPEPYNDADWGGWFVWRSFGARYSFDDATGARVINLGFEVDSKAMRKVTPNETLVVIAESQSGAFDIFDGTRNLIKLP